MNTNLFYKKISIRWADIDANFHLRHSVYYDLAAQQRIEILNYLGLTMETMQNQGFGPILFREECIFKKEIRLADHIFINTKLAKMKPDASRWSIQHEFLTTENKLCAIINIDGAWMDTKQRKLLTSMPTTVTTLFNSFPKTHDFIFS